MDGCQAATGRSFALKSQRSHGAQRSLLCVPVAGPPSGSIGQCDEALRLQPDFPNARFKCGTALAAEGKKAEAIAEFSRILATDSNNTNARAALKQLQG